LKFEYKAETNNHTSWVLGGLPLSQIKANMDNGRHLKKKNQYNVENSLQLK